MSLFFLLFTLLAAVLATAAPTPRDTSQWFTVEWDAPEFTAMSGDFVIPDVPSQGGIPLVWPGLQGHSGALQAELRGQPGSWSIGNSFYGLLSLSPGTRFDVSPGDTVHFSFTRITDSGLWMATLSGAQSRQQTFSIPSSVMTRAILAINLGGATHDFTVAYSNVVITAASAPAASWCGSIASNGYDGGYTVKDAVAEGTTCRIGQIILPGTA